MAYSPKELGREGAKSKRFCRAIKRGQQSKRRPVTISRLVVDHMVSQSDLWGLHQIFSGKCVVVPVPGHAPRKPSSLWVPYDICQDIVNSGIALEIFPCIERHTRVLKSAYARPEDRASVFDHYNSLRITNAAPPISLDGARIVLVDDVVTRGSTFLAAASRISEVYPDHEIKVFALVRTVSRGAVDEMVSPRVGTITIRREHGNRD